MSEEREIVAEEPVAPEAPEAPEAPVATEAPVAPEESVAAEAPVATEAPQDERPEIPDPTDGVPEAQRLGMPAKIEALLFLSPDPLSVAQLVEALEAGESQVEEALSALEEDCQTGRRGIVLRKISGGYTLASAPGSDSAARRLFAKPRTPPLTQAQAECLAIIAYLQPVSRPEIARIRGVNSESALSTLLERGLIADAGRSQFGALIFKTTELFDRLFGLEGLDALPDVAAFDPSPDDERDLRERLLKAGEQREAAAPNPQG